VIVRRRHLIPLSPKVAAGIGHRARSRHDSKRNDRWVGRATRHAGRHQDGSVDRAGVGAADRVERTTSTPGHEDGAPSMLQRTASSDQRSQLDSGPALATSSPGRHGVVSRLGVLLSESGSSPPSSVCAPSSTRLHPARARAATIACQRRTTAVLAGSRFTSLR